MRKLTNMKKKILTQCKVRRIAPIGRLTIPKMLIIPTLNHLAWHCQCQMIFLKKILRDYLNFYATLKYINLKKKTLLFKIINIGGLK